jgi:CubicO group peptidase (beta-lactamase class C family)
MGLTFFFAAGLAFPSDFDFARGFDFVFTAAIDSSHCLRIGYISLVGVGSIEQGKDRMGKTILLLRLLNCAIVLWGSNLALAQQPEASPMEAINQFIEAQMRKQQIPGLSLAVVKDGKLLLTHGYGLADVELNVAATPETVFQIQSITKTFTASAIMMLSKEGKVGLDDEIGKYLQGVPETWKGITIRRLLNHTSGIKDYINEPYASLRIETTDEDVFRETAKRPLNFQPGEKYAYCNTGYLLLGMVIRKTSGEPYGEFLRKRIFQPLGMSNTRVISLKEIIPRRASGYSLEDGKLIRGDYVADSILSYPGGGIVSTVLDMAKYEAIWLGHQLLEESTIKEMWTQGTLNDTSRTIYGLGWGINDLRGERFFTHSGGHMTGFASRYAVFPKHRMSIIILSNRNETNTDVIVQGVAGLVDERLHAPGMMKEKTEDDPGLREKLAKAVISLANDQADVLLIAPLLKALNEEQKSTLKAALPTAETMRFLGVDDVSGKDISPYGTPAVQLRYYRMKHGNKMRYFKCYLAADGKMAGLSFWDD